MAPLFGRLKERKLGQWGCAYLAGAWVVYEATGTALEAWAVPVFLIRSIHVLLLFGFVGVLIGAWYHGEKGKQRVTGPELLMIALLLVMAGAVLSMLGEAGGDITSPAEALPAPAAPGDRPFVAALPFVNLSPLPGDAYLADGFHEELIAQLYKIGGLGVISRTSVMGYRDLERNMRQIASELGATAVVEGSVQKVGARVRLTIQLIDPGADDHLWMDQYDLDFSLDDLLDVQADIAEQIARALKAELTPAEQVRLDTRHTEDWDAYQAYLRGVYFLHRPHYTSEDVERALEEFRHATELDPGFALAWAVLAESHARQVYYWTDASKERIRAARHAAERARAAGELSPEVQLMLASARLHLDRDAEQALREIDRAARELPNDPEIRWARSAAFQIQGRFREAIEEQERLLTQSPRDAAVHTDLIFLNWVARDYAEAEAQADLARGLAADHMWPNLGKVLVVWSHRGPTHETRRLADGLAGNDGWVVWARYWDRMMKDEYAEAIQCLRGWDDAWVRTKMWARPLVMYEGWAHWAMEDTARAASLFHAAAELLEAETVAHPDDPRYHSSLGIAYAALGQADDALHEGRRAMALLPVSTDAFYSLGYVWDMAFTYTLLGDDDHAIQLLEELLGIPSWLSPVWLEHEFRFDPLKRDPRFQALVRG